MGNSQSNSSNGNKGNKEYHLGLMSNLENS